MRSTAARPTASARACSGFAAWPCCPAEGGSNSRTVSAGRAGRLGGGAGQQGWRYRTPRHLWEAAWGVRLMEGLSSSSPVSYRLTDSVEVCPPVPGLGNMASTCLRRTYQVPQELLGAGNGRASTETGYLLSAGPGRHPGSPFRRSLRSLRVRQLWARAWDRPDLDPGPVCSQEAGPSVQGNGRRGQRPQRPFWVQLPARKPLLGALPSAATGARTVHRPACRGGARGGGGPGEGWGLGSACGWLGCCWLCRGLRAGHTPMCPAAPCPCRRSAQPGEGRRARGRGCGRSAPQLLWAS